jgi:FKBP-type peptidyl-prolyl cis-trans isomerase SlyD
MNIENDKVVEFHYTLTNDKDEVLDASKEKGPLAYLHGKGNIIVGLEKEMLGKKVGDKFKASIEATEAYGERRDDLVRVVEKKMFQGVEKVEAGMQFQFQSPEGPMLVLVTEVEGEEVTIDHNHPLAGQALHFDVDVISVRDATEEEMTHGHAHGEGGHQH